MDEIEELRGFSKWPARRASPAVETSVWSKLLRAGGAGQAYLRYPGVPTRRRSPGHRLPPPESGGFEAHSVGFWGRPLGVGVDRPRSHP